MLKKYCLRNYLDNYKEVINDFVVTFDYDKIKQKKAGETVKVAKEDVGESEIEFIGKLKAFRDQEYINIKNPEYILALLAEDTIMNLIQKEENEEITEEMYEFERK